MVANDRTTISILYWDMFVGTVVGGAATVPLGFGGKDATMVVTAEKRVDEHRVPNLGGPLIIDAELSNLKFETTLAQIEPAVLAAGLGVTEDGNDVVIGGSDPTITAIPVKVVGTTVGGSAITCLMYRGVSTSEVAMTSGKGEMVSVPIEFMGEDDETNGMGKITVGASNVDATLSSDVLTRIAGQGFHRVAGEGAAADDLASITGSLLVNEELLTLGIADADDAITAIHLNDTLELHGDVNWTMDSLQDRLYLQYNTANTKWVEVGRYDDPA